MKLNKCISVFLFLIVAISPSFSQIEQGYYLFPIKPGERNFLAGNMSELRPNHFHTGLDIKTDGKEGLPVHAAADGYIYRMKISSFGYGNILYLRHENGQITAYAHLRDFAPPVAEYMRKQMYEQESNELEVYLDEQTFPVKKGDTIAFSGNSGSSMGPHLHFEIRDSLDRAIDPLKFGFSEIIDTTPPTVTRVAITPLEINSRVNGQFRREEFGVTYDGEAFYINQPVHIIGKVGIEIRGFDKLDDMYNPNGFPRFEVFEGDSSIFKVDVDRIDFQLSRFFLTHTYQQRFTRLYKRANNPFHFYRPDLPLSGAISAEAGEEKRITVWLSDVYDNQTQLRINFRGSEPIFALNRTNKTGGRNSISYQDNVMIVNGRRSDAGTLAKFYVNSHVMEIPLAYEDNNKRTYLWDMTYGIPDSIDICTEVVKPQVLAKLPFEQKTWVSDGRTSITAEENSLLDDLYLKLEYGELPSNPTLKINDSREYLRNNIEVVMAAAGYPGNKEKAHVYQEYPNGYKSFLGGEWNHENIRFRTRNFGTFVVAEDSIPPRINPLRVNSRSLRFSITDNLSGIGSFEADVEGEWVLMRYEHKQNVIWSERLEDKPLKGKVTLKVTDRAGNQAVYQTEIK